MSDAGEGQRDMVFVPLKHSSYLDLVGPLGRHIKKSYSSSKRKELDDALLAMQQMRLDVSRITTASDPARRLLRRYHAQLEFAERRFPVSRSNIALYISWSDAFTTKKKTTMPSLAFERAGVLFNIAALECKAGAEADRSTEEGVREAAQHFQTAAGLFDHLRDHVCPSIGGTDELTFDLSPDGLTMLKQLCLAQAQECFYEKGAKSSMGDALLARIAAQTAIMYEDAATRVEPCKNAKIMWFAYLRFKAKWFAARAQYRQAKVALAKTKKEGKGFGEYIAWLKGTLESCTEGLEATTKLAGPTTLALVPKLEDLRTVVAKEKEGADQDNVIVYMETVPETPPLASISPALLAKSLPPPDDLTQDVDADLFKKLDEAVEQSSGCLVM